jgi:hypothetical protein
MQHLDASIIELGINRLAIREQQDALTSVRRPPEVIGFLASTFVDTCGVRNFRHPSSEHQLFGRLQAFLVLAELGNFDVQML